MASKRIRIGLRLQLEKKWQIIWCQIQVVHWCIRALVHHPIGITISFPSRATYLNPAMHTAQGSKWPNKFSETKSLQRLVYLASQLIQVHLDFSFFLQRTLFQRIYAIFREIVNIVWFLQKIQNVYIFHKCHLKNKSLLGLFDCFFQTK